MPKSEKRRISSQSLGNPSGTGYRFILKPDFQVTINKVILFFETITPPIKLKCHLSTDETGCLVFISRYFLLFGSVELSCLFLEYRLEIGNYTRTQIRNQYIHPVGTRTKRLPTYLMRDSMSTPALPINKDSKNNRTAAPPTKPSFR